MWFILKQQLTMNPTKQIDDSISSHELIKMYVEEKMEIVRLELILDNLYMAKAKNKDWMEKNNIAQSLYNETKERIDFLNHLWDMRKHRNSKK